MIYIVALLCCFVVIALNVLMLSGEYDHIIPAAFRWEQDRTNAVRNKPCDLNNALYNTKAKGKVDNVKDGYYIQPKENMQKNYSSKYTIYNIFLCLKDFFVGVFSAIAFYVSIMLPYTVYTLIFGGVIYAIAYGIGYLWGSLFN